ncbi:MAG TPA: FkbM family methyltransferase [Granulicella sp.]
MAFENVGSILRMGSVAGSLKLLPLAASSSRPRYRSLFLGLLRPFTKNGEVRLSYRCYGRRMQCMIRLSDLSSDVYSVFELSIRDSYELERGFRPDLVIDGGANIGLFTLRAAAAAADSGPTNFVVCEPLPRNLEQIRKHCKLNGVQVDVLAGCLGGQRDSIPFYCREALSSSFDPHKPYDSIMQMPVYTLDDALDLHPAATRLLIKLDIEGMEMEVLRGFVPRERRPVYVVGELHDVATNAEAFERIFRDHDWAFEFREIGHEHATFRACSPAAFPLLPWSQRARRESPVAVNR